MKCQEIHRQIFPYLEGELSPDRAGAFKEHLHGCPECESLVTGMRAVGKVIDQEKAVELRPFASARILAGIDRGLNPASREPAGVLKPLLIAASLVGALALGTLIGKAGQSVSRVSTETSPSIETLKQDLFIPDFADEALPILTDF